MFIEEMASRFLEDTSDVDAALNFADSVCDMAEDEPEENVSIIIRDILDCDDYADHNPREAAHVLYRQISEAIDEDGDYRRYPCWVVLINIAETIIEHKEC